MLLTMAPMKAAAANAQVVTTTVTETDTTKTIVYGPETLKKLAEKYGAFGNGELAEHEAYPEDDAENASNRLAYKFAVPHTWGNNSGAGQLFLTKDNGENLVSVQVDMAKYTGNGHIAFGFGTELDSNGAGSLNGKYFGQVGNWSNYKWIVRDLLTADNSHAGNGNIAWIILGMAQGQDIGYAFSSVTATYNKSDADYALEAAIRKAEAFPDADAAVERALAAAKEYVGNTETAALASQAEIVAATETLTKAMNGESEVTVTWTTDVSTNSNTIRFLAAYEASSNVAGSASIALITDDGKFTFETVEETAIYADITDVEDADAVFTAKPYVIMNGKSYVGDAISANLSGKVA